MTHSTHDQSRIDLLLVEDDALDARLLRSMLLGLEWSHMTIRRHVTRLTDGVAALGASPYDAVLLDLNLPDSFGLDTFERMRGTAERVPVVILTSLKDLELAQMAVDGGAMDYLVKGEFDARLLTRTIQFAIRHHNLQQDLEDTQERLRETSEELDILREETGEDDG